MLIFFHNILISLSIVGYCCIFRKSLRWPIEVMPFFVVSAIIILLYIFAYFDILKIGRMALILFGGVCLVTLPIYLPRKFNQLMNDFLTPGFCIFIFYLIYFGYIAQFTSIRVISDEISRWMPHAKLIFIHHGFILSSDSTINQDYPPGAALFYYLFFYLNSYSEETLFFAQVLLLLSPMMVLLQGSKWNNAGVTFLFFSFFLYILSHLFRVKLGAGGTVLMDIPTGLFFGGILVNYFLMDQTSKRWFHTIIPAMAMVLLRPMVFPFIALITLIILYNATFIEKTNKRLFFQNFLYLGTIIFPLFVLFSWQCHLKQFKVANSWSLMSLMKAIYHQTSLLNSEEFRSVLSLFLKNLWPEVGFAVFMITFALSLTKFSKNSQLTINIKIIHFLLLLGFIFYLITLLMFYLYQWTAFISLSLNSFHRLMYIYEIGWFLILTTHCMQIFSGIWNRNISKLSHSMIYLSVVVVLILLAKNVFYRQNLYYQVFKQNKGFEYMNFEAKQIVKALQEQINSSARVGIVGTLLVPLFAYHLIPVSTNLFYGNFDKMNFFLNELKSLDYLILADVDEQFWKLYNPYFLTTNRTPLAIFTFCRNSSGNPYLDSDCDLHNAFIYLYKITKQNNQIALLNMTSPAKLKQ